MCAAPSPTDPVEISTSSVSWYEMGKTAPHQTPSGSAGLKAFDCPANTELRERPATREVSRRPCLRFNIEQCRHYRCDGCTRRLTAFLQLIPVYPDMISVMDHPTRQLQQTLRSSSATSQGWNDLRNDIYFAVEGPSIPMLILFTAATITLFSRHYLAIRRINCQFCAIILLENKGTAQRRKSRLISLIGEYYRSCSAMAGLAMDPAKLGLSFTMPTSRQRS